MVIVYDGSVKMTPLRADAWQERYPNIIKAVHQENGRPRHVMKAVSLTCVLKTLTQMTGRRGRSEDLPSAARTFTFLINPVDLVLITSMSTLRTTHRTCDYRDAVPTNKIIIGKRLAASSCLSTFDARNTYR